MTSTGHIQPPDNAGATLDDEEETTSVTSQLCQWKIPKQRKESDLPMSAAVFEKHDYRKNEKRKVSLTEDFDPRPLEFRGNAKFLLPNFLKSVQSESLGISILLDPQHCHVPTPASAPNLPSISELKETVTAFKETLMMPTTKLNELEYTTRNQRYSELWHSVRRYRITASRFGDILHRKSTTPPDVLVLSILKPRTFTCDATSWGIQNESKAIEAYIAFQHHQGKHVTVGPVGFFVSASHPFLGATPDGMVHDHTNEVDEFGFIEVKCPYVQRDLTPLEASLTSGFCSRQVSNTCKTACNYPELKLRQNHKYYAQVQGQMAVGGMKWCDFVIFTNKGINVERIVYNDDYWKPLLAKLESFFDNCLGPEIVSPIHVLGYSIRDLSKV
jgi:hypothetical protein